MGAIVYNNLSAFEFSSHVLKTCDQEISPTRASQNSFPKTIIMLQDSVRRMDSVASHLAAPKAAATSGISKGRMLLRIAKAPKSPDDVVIVSALRSALTKGGKGGFKETHPEYIMAKVLKAIIDQTGIAPEIVQDIQVGNVLMPGAGVTTARMAALYAGYL